MFIIPALDNTLCPWLGWLQVPAAAAVSDDYLMPDIGYGDVGDDQAFTWSWINYIGANKPSRRPAARPR